MEGAEAVFTMVPEGEHARQVFLGAGGVLEHVPPGTVLVDCSPIDIHTALDLHRAAQDAGCPFVDAPVSRGTIGADAGTLTAMCGGLPESVAAAETYLRPMTQRSFRRAVPVPARRPR